MQYKNFILDPFQEEAIHAIENNQSVVVSAPTGSGKTLIADFIIEKHKNDTKKIIYTAPIKALSNQKYKDFSKEYGENKVGLMTGDTVINPTAKILIMTTEIYRNMVIAQDEEINDVAYVVLDEIHYINDIERGYVWEESIIYSPETVRFLCLSATIPNAQEFSNWISAIKKHPVKTIISTTRSVPLEKIFYDQELGLTTLEKIKAAKDIPEYGQIFKQRGEKRKKERPPVPNHLDVIKALGKEKLPCLYFHFSRHACQEKAEELARKNLFPKNTKIVQFISEKLRDAPSEINRLRSTHLLRETLPQGIGFHHAGLLPILKEIVEELFAQGLINVLYVTETFAVGINMPAKTVCFDSLRKFDGINFRMLNTKEFFQIAGRAGRRGIDKIGYVIVLIYRPTFNYKEIKNVTNEDVDPIKSQFRLSVNTVLNLLGRHNQEEIEKILRLSFDSYQKFGINYEKIPSKILMATYYNIVKKLEKLEFVREGVLTQKGTFSSRIFADEITTGEIFATEFSDQLDEFQILLLMACLVYEPRGLDEFRKEFRTKEVYQLQKILSQNEYLSREKKFNSIFSMTTLIHPVYYGMSFFEIMKMTNFLEGDLIRFYAQVVDRLTQIKKSSPQSTIALKMDNCKGLIEKMLEGIYLI